MVCVGPIVRSGYLGFVLAAALGTAGVRVVVTKRPARVRPTTCRTGIVPHRLTASPWPSYNQTRAGQTHSNHYRPPTYRKRLREYLWVTFTYLPVCLTFPIFSFMRVLELLFLISSTAFVLIEFRWLESRLYFIVGKYCTKNTFSKNFRECLLHLCYDWNLFQWTFSSKWSPYRRVNY